MPKSEHLTVEQVGLAPDALAGQVAVVTGGGQGIGREIALAFARLGACVVIAEISATGQETERIIQEAGGQALFVKTDVSSEADVLALARRTQSAFGPADVLINNAILSPVAPVLEMDVALWDRVMAVNYSGGTDRAVGKDAGSKRTGRSGVLRRPAPSQSPAGRTARTAVDFSQYPIFLSPDVNRNVLRWSHA